MLQKEKNIQKETLYYSQNQFHNNSLKRPKSISRTTDVKVASSPPQRLGLFSPNLIEMTFDILGTSRKFSRLLLKQTYKNNYLENNEHTKNVMKKQHTRRK